jgi:TonB family protein
MMSIMKNYYEILEVDYHASFKEIRSAFRRLSKKYHPDLNAGDTNFEEHFKDLQEAYQVLKDGIRREEFDAQLKLQGIRQTGLKSLKYFIRNKFSSRKNSEVWADEEANNENVYGQGYQHHRSANFAKALIILIVSVLMIILVFFVESNFDNEDDINRTIAFDTETQIPQPLDLVERPAITQYPKSSDLNIKNLSQSTVKEQLSIDEKNIKTKSEDPYNHQVSNKASAEEEAVPVTIFNVNKTEDPIKTETKPATIPVSTVAETKSSVIDVNKVYKDVEKKPMFAGGSPAFVQYLNENLQYPATARERGIDGRVLVTFIVEKDGNISDISVIQGIGGGCDEEAIRVMKNAPSWLPGENGGQKVRVQCTIPITFKLQ